MLSLTMSRLQKDLPAEVGLLSFTVDPDRDDIPRLAAYARQFAAEPARWLFVTGQKEPLYDILIAGFKVPVVSDLRAPSGQRITHSTRLALIDGQGRLRGYFDAEDQVALERLKKIAAKLN